MFVFFVMVMTTVGITLGVYYFMTRRPALGALLFGLGLLTCFTWFMLLIDNFLSLYA